MSLSATYVADIRFYGGLCCLRKHGSIRPQPAGKLKYFRNSFVIFERTFG